MTARRRRGQLKPVGKVVGLVLGDLGLEGARAAYEIAQQWPQFVGEEAALHSRPLRVRRGVLEAEVDSSVWCQQLQFRRAAIVAAIAEAFGEAAPHDLRFQVGSLHSSN